MDNGNLNDDGGVGNDFQVDATEVVASSSCFNAFDMPEFSVATFLNNSKRF